MSQGTFILADIGGYTPFLAGVAIEHAKEITGHLLNGILKENRGRWKVANLEGDCIFFYREGLEPASDLLAHARRLYERFCDRVIDISARAACPCGACTRVNQLALKFIVHAGEFDTQRIGGRQELIGADVVVGHRLLKNSVPIDEYLLLTCAYADPPPTAGLPAAQGRDQYDGIGPVDYAYLDMEPLRKAVEESLHFFITPDQARFALTIDIDIDAAPELVYDALCDQEKHLQWSGEKEHWESPGRHGRIGQVHRCVGTDGWVSVWVLTAVDDGNRRRTSKQFPTRLLRDVYATQEVRERQDAGSRLVTYATFREATPVVSHLAGPLMHFVAKRGLRKGLLRLKAYCEQEAS